jgi:hypothetical protein
MSAKFLSIALLAASGFAAPAPCPLLHKIVPADTLAALGGFYFGNQDFAPAILVATNSRVSANPPKIDFIPNPFTLTPGNTLCIPDSGEAQRDRARYQTYQKAVAGMAVTQPWEVADSTLVVIPPGRPVTAATYTRVGKFKTGTIPAPGDVWITVEPYLKDFCHKFLTGHNNDLDELTSRLEERLGLPPAAGYTTVARIQLDAATAKVVFRPCSDPSTAVANCQAGPPSGSDPAYAAWFSGQYYSAYGLPRPNLYPWTSLGYTFDWAQGDNGEFERIGESEFVIPNKTPINVIEIMSTADYCAK